LVAFNKKTKSGTSNTIRYAKEQKKQVIVTTGIGKEGMILSVEKDSISEIKNHIYCGDCVKVMQKLPKNSVDVVITSPPYWNLRDYQAEGQIGLESHPQKYINNLVKVAKQIRRILKKKGNFFLNLGDTYCGGGIGQKDDGKKWLQPKQLLLIPSRVACALQEDGWILRNDIMWVKDNPMPCPVKDRLNNSYEHLFHFVKNKKYYYDLDKIREPHKFESIKRACRGRESKKLDSKQYAIHYKEKYKGYHKMEQLFENGELRAVNPKGKNPGDVISSDKEDFRNKKLNPIGGMRQAPEPNEPNAFHPMGKNPGDIFKLSTQPFSGQHFAVFPLSLIDKPLRATLPEDGIVLDPFGGRGTVARWTRENWGNYVVIDVNREYCEMAYNFIYGQKIKVGENQSLLSSWSNEKSHREKIIIDVEEMEDYGKKENKKKN